MKTVSQKAKLIISNELAKKVTYLHNKIGSVEWSGVLMYSIVSGAIEKPSELVLKADDLYLMDVGTSSYTEYELGGEEMMKMYDIHPELDPFESENPKKIGHIHTHHSMATFFSGTDTKELEENAPNHNYYLSLIVNFDCKWCAKIAISAEVESNQKYTWVGENGEEKKTSLSSKSKETMTIDCDIEFEGVEVTESRIKEIEDAKTPVKNYYGGWGNNGWSNSKNNKNYNYSKNKINNYLKKTAGGKETDISKDQVAVFSDKIAWSQVREYILELIQLGIVLAYKPATITEGFNHIDSEGDEDLQLWKDMVEEEYAVTFGYMFPNTTTSIDEVAYEISNFCADYSKRYYSATFLEDFFAEIHGNTSDFSKEKVSAK